MRGSVAGSAECPGQVVRATATAARQALVLKVGNSLIPEKWRKPTETSRCGLKALGILFSKAVRGGRQMSGLACAGEQFTKMAWNLPWGWV